MAIAAIALSGATGLAQRDDPGSPRVAAPLTILQLNDVYAIGPVAGDAGDVGGLARVATLKQRFAAAGRTPLLMLAGDFLSSSVESTVFKGEQMIAALNAAGLDVATLGNHEFDFGIDVLLQRMSEAKFQWVISNVVDRQTGRPIGNAAPFLVRSFGGLKVGIIGLCLTTEGIGRDKLERIQLVDPIDAAAKYVPMLEAEHVNVIVALTHLNFADDRALAARFPEIDVIVGGHEHYPITATENRTLISKAGSDAKFVARIDINRTAAGVVERFFELIPVNAGIEEEPATAALVKSYMDRLGTAMNTVVGRTEVALDAVSQHVRSVETNVGDLIADAMRAEVSADVALVNSGGIRGDRVHPAGPITRRQLIELHPFGNVVCKIEVPGRVLLAALNHGVARLPVAAGQFPQVAGLTMRVAAGAPAGDRVRDVTIQGKPLDASATYTLALPDYVLTGGDGYTMFEATTVIVDAQAGTLLPVALEHFITAKGTIAPQTDGRITIDR